MRSEAPAPVGALDVDGHPACGVCGCVHRVTERLNAGLAVTYDQGCPCGCTASGALYDRGIVDLYLLGPDHDVDDRPTAHHDHPAGADLRCDVDHNAGLAVHTGTRERRSVQHTERSVRRLRDRVHIPGAYVAVARVLRRALAGAAGNTGPGSAGVVRPLWMDAVEQRPGLRIVRRAEDATW